jgi:hypothetical protein
MIEKSKTQNRSIRVPVTFSLTRWKDWGKIGTRSKRKRQPPINADEDSQPKTGKSASKQGAICGS